MSRIQEYKRNLSLALQGGRYEEALAILGKLVSQSENQPAYHNQIGDIYLKTGKQTQAVDSFMRGVEGYQLLEMYPNGAALCKKVLRLEPMHKDAAWTLGELKTRQGFLADGAEKMLEALHMFAEDPATTRDNILDKLSLAEQLQGGCLQVLEFAATTYAQFGESQSARGVTLRIAEIEEREGNLDKANNLRAFAEQFVADETETLPPVEESSATQAQESAEFEMGDPVSPSGSLPGVMDPVPDGGGDVEEILPTPPSPVEVVDPVPEMNSTPTPETVVTPAAEITPPPETIPPVDRTPEPVIESPSEPVMESPPEHPAPPELQYPHKYAGTLSPEDDTLLETFDSGLPEVDVEILQPGGSSTAVEESPQPAAEVEQLKLDTLFEEEEPTASGRELEDITIQGVDHAFLEVDDDLELTIHAVNIDSIPTQPEPAPEVETTADAQPTVVSFDEEEKPSQLHRILEDTIQGGPITVGLTTTAGEAFQTDDISLVLKEFRARMAEQADNMALDERYQLGVSYMEMDLYAEALQEFEATLDHPTLGKKTREWMGRCHLALQQPQALLALLDPYLKRESYPEKSSIELYYLLGQANQLLDNNDRALDAFTKVYSLNSDFRDVQNRLENLTIAG